MGKILFCNHCDSRIPSDNVGGSSRNREYVGEMGQWSEHQNRDNKIN